MVIFIKNIVGKKKIKFLQCQMPRIQTVVRSDSELLDHYGSATSSLYILSNTGAFHLESKETVCF